MDMLLVIIMLVLFIFLMVFVFSTALLTPLIGKRNLIFVLSLGFIVGIVGGAFFIAPLYDDIPDMARAVFTSTTGGPEIININMSTDSDVTAFIENTKKINGVKDVQCNKITIRTVEFNTSDWSNTFKNGIPVLESDVNSVDVISNDTLILNLNKNNNPMMVVKNVKDWLALVAGVEIISNIAEVSITVDPSQVDAVSDKIPQNEVVISNVTGPVEDQITSFKKNLPDKNSLIILCGIIGMLVGLLGLFIDSISQLVSKIRDRMNKKE
ncbi:MAG: hypothetical protein LLF83_08515 [Methanobacterium sp.]|nr:hypothetical protein [Methanobacterium sp.]